MSQKTLSGEQVLHGRPLSPADSRASRSVLPGSARARGMTAISGRKCSAWCGSPGPLGSLERMLLGSSAWHSTMCVLIWSVKVTPAGRSYFRLRGSVPRTREIGSSLWPTPHANCHTGPGEHGDGGMNLQTAVQGYPTPSASMRTLGDLNQARFAGSDPRRPDYVTANRMMPTPTVTDARGHTYTYDRGDHTKPRLSLAGVAQLVPTPCAQDGKNATLPPSQRGRDSIPGALIRSGTSGSLNPRWVEWLQGFPDGWTDLWCSGMRSSRSRRIRSSRRSRRSRRGR